jgi:hypothetical protein
VATWDTNPVTVATDAATAVTCVPSPETVVTIPVTADDVAATVVTSPVTVAAVAVN